MSSAKEYAVWLDIETTGLDLERHEILSIGAVRVHMRTLDEVERFSCLVVPRHLETASEEALAINGYTPQGWVDAIPLVDALQQLSPLLEGAALGGHNVNFDWAFILRAYQRLELPVPKVDYHRIDTSAYAYLAFTTGAVDSLSLDPVCKLYGIERPTPHSALDDALASLEVARAHVSNEKFHAVMKQYDSWNETPTVPLDTPEIPHRSWWYHLEYGESVEVDRVVTCVRAAEGRIARTQSDVEGMPVALSFRDDPHKQEAYLFRKVSGKDEYWAIGDGILTVGAKAVVFWTEGQQRIMDLRQFTSDYVRQTNTLSVCLLAAEVSNLAQHASNLADMFELGELTEVAEQLHVVEGHARAAVAEARAIPSMNEPQLTPDEQANDPTRHRGAEVTVDDLRSKYLAVEGDPEFVKAVLGAAKNVPVPSTSDALEAASTNLAKHTQRLLDSLTPKEREILELRRAVGVKGGTEP